MSAVQLTEEAIFNVARRIDHSDARRQYLDQVCADDVGLRQRIELLLEIDLKEPEFLVQPPADLAATVDSAVLIEGPGAEIGPYRLLEKIGEGGMGLVFMAQQRSPVKRFVALKIIKPGLDSQLVLSRFEAERQALAMMDHPHIAKILDAGTTDSGRPYFVMELVKGVPITEYCDRARLSIRERLALFVSVCHAVQHAHQKGIIHRDIKPQNVLVARFDDKPVVKVIDFGVAKALNHELTGGTLFTRFGEIVGTFEYMSPEQAQFNQLDIDTRSDVYSLGVLLYEILTGKPPFDRQRFQTAALDEVFQIIRDEEPMLPSVRISTLGGELPKVCEKRATHGNKLPSFVRGDLDWIVMMALEKDRTRRYDTANELAADVMRFVNDLPVRAQRASPFYRARKFVRRHRGTVAAAVLLLACLVVGGGFSLSQWTRAVAAIERRDALVKLAAESLWSLSFVEEYALDHGFEDSYFLDTYFGGAKGADDFYRAARQMCIDERGETDTSTKLATAQLAGTLATLNQDRQALKLLKESGHDPPSADWIAYKRIGLPVPVMHFERKPLSRLLESKLALTKLRDPSSSDDDLRTALQLTEAHVLPAAKASAAEWWLRGWAHYRAAEYDSALNCADHSLRLPREPTETWFLLALCHWKLGNSDVAKDWFLAALDRFNTFQLQAHVPTRGDSLRIEQMSQLKMECVALMGNLSNDSDELVAAYSRLIASWPKLNSLTDRRGRQYAGQGNWEAAISDLSLNGENWHVAPIYLYLGDKEKLSELTPLDSKHYDMVDLWLWSLNPASQPNLQAETFVRTAPCRTTWERTALGTVAYRCGKWQKSIDSLPNHRSRDTLHANLFRAMAYHKLGHSTQAQFTLNETRQDIHHLIPAPNAAGVDLITWCVVQGVLREAELTIEEAQSE